MALFVRQLFDLESSTYTYLVYDPKTREAAIMDSVRERAERDLKLVRELGLNLKYVLETHVHADHITGADLLRSQTQAQVGLSAESQVECADLYLKDGDEVFLGEHSVRVISTPGHTNTCLSYYAASLGDGAVFTGDALFIRGTGRTDFQSGSSEGLYQSITLKLFKLPDETLVYPGHDYNGQSHSTLLEEKKYNPRVGGGKTQGDFVEIMKNLNLAPPKKIHEAVPANLKCGKI